MHLPGRPSGSPTEIRAAANGFRFGGTRLGDQLSRLQSHVGGVLAAWEGDDRDAFAAQWTKLSRNIESLAHKFADIAGKLDSYADDLEHAQHRYDEILVAAGITVGVGVALTVFTFGLSDAAAAGAVSAEVGGVIATVEAMAASVYTALTSLYVELTMFAIEFPVLTASIAAGVTVTGIDLASDVPLKESLEDGVLAFGLTYLVGGGDARRGAPAGEVEPATVIEENGYRYELNAEGRPIRVSGNLHFGDEGRDRAAAARVRALGDPTDDAGHVIARQFDGPKGVHNLVPQDSELNRYGEWRDLEREWAHALGDGRSVYVDVHLDAPGGGRPSVFEVEFRVDDTWFSRVIENH